MRLASVLLAPVAITLFCVGAIAADLGSGGPPAQVSLRDALSRYLAVELIRATFDVVPREDVAAGLEQQAGRWHSSAPTEAEIADLDQELLVEAGYYLTSLRYVVSVGGAVFPSDMADAVYANDTLSQLDDLRRSLFSAVEEGGDVLPILGKVEQIRALTEGYAAVPEAIGFFTSAEDLLDATLENVGSDAST